MKRGCILIMLGMLFSGCGLSRSTKYDSYPENPYPNVETVAVLPFVNETPVDFDGEEFGNICASELAKYPGFRVYRPYQVRQMLKDASQLRDIDALLTLGREMKVDAVLAVGVTDYDPYEPPKIALRVQLIRITAGRRQDAADLDRATRAGRYLSLPVPLPGAHAGRLMAAFDVVYDAHTRALQAEIHDYLDAQKRDELGFKDLREFMMVQPRFIQFVSSQFLDRLLVMAGEPA